MFARPSYLGSNVLAQVRQDGSVEGVDAQGAEEEGGAVGQVDLARGAPVVLERHLHVVECLLHELDALVLRARVGGRQRGPHEHVADAGDSRVQST